MPTVAAYIVDQLVAWGVRHVYGVAGDTFLPLLDEIGKEPGLRFIPVRHESAAGFMASAEAKLCGRIGVCVATSGPGIANLINGLGDAYADRVPVLAITGQVDSTKIGTYAKQYVDQQALVRAIAGFTAQLNHPNAIGVMLLSAMRTALGNDCVAHISVPKDLFNRPCDAEVFGPEPFLHTPPEPAESVVAGALHLMQAAQRPLLLIGEGSRTAAAEVQTLAERWGAGVIHSMPAKGVLPGLHPLALGGLGPAGSEAAHAALQEADLLLTVACNWWPQTYVPARLPVVKVDRTPVNIGGKMQVAYGVPGDARAVLQRLLAGLGDQPGGREDWRSRLAALRSDWLHRLDAETAPDGPPLSPQHIVRALERAVPPDAVIALDTGDHTVWFNRVFLGERQQVLLSGTWRSLGFGLPAALGAKLCQPDRTVVALVGDTGLQSLLGELTTAAEIGLPVVTVLVNNHQMAIERNRAEARDLLPVGTAPLTPDFAAVAEACGLKAFRANTPAELAGALAGALRHPGPTFVVATASAPVAPTAEA